MKKTLFANWVALGMDPNGIEQCQYKFEGKRIVGYIKEFNEDSIVVKPMSVDFHYGTYSPVTFNVSEFDEIELEIFDDARGCDNSAIGVQGCYEPWSNFVW